MTEDRSDGERRVAEKETRDEEADLENWVPLSVREARMARKRREEVWPWVWISFASIVLLGVALAILAYRLGV